MTPKQLQAIKLALEALKQIDEAMPFPVAKLAQKAIKEALAQTEQGPVAIKRMKEWIEYLKRKSDFGQHMKIPSEMSAGTCWELALELEQFINTTPPHRKPLTDEEIQYAFRTNSVMVDNGNAYMVAGMRAVNITRAIEAAHGIKENT